MDREDPFGSSSDEPFAESSDELKPASFTNEPQQEPEPVPEEGVRRGGLMPRIRSETTLRILWAIPLIIAAIAIVVIDGTAFTATMLVLGCLGLREFFRMTELTRPLLPPAYAGLTAMVLVAHWGNPEDLPLVFAALFPAMFAFAAARESRPAITVSMGITVLGVAWIGGAFAHAVLLRDLPDHGGALLIDVLVATFLTDTFAYGGGRLFGSRAIAPVISPNKTLEGLFAGFIGGTLGFWFAGLYQDWLSGLDALLMGMAIALIAPVGDLFASMIKRDTEIKDTGSLFGPHGGLIDRLDAVLFTVVVGYYLSLTFVY
ncbi:MAG: hypothetical protein EXQ70_01225 [Solirubrobacterales bacterium]|nr:hypothetical protein [Solirubrobacterales bacterium]